MSLPNNLKEQEQLASLLINLNVQGFQYALISMCKNEAMQVSSLVI